jgi:plastocyanin
VTVAERLQGRTGTVLVYLESLDGRTFEPPRAREVILQKDAKFVPSFLVVTLGQAVDFVNAEETLLEHNVFSSSETKSFDLGLYGPSKDAPPRSVLFDKAGEVSIYCSIHSLMEATVYVTPTPFRAKVDAKTGQFEIKGVPKGRWRARTWVSTKRCPNASAEFAVRSGETAKVELALGRKG